MNPTPQTTIKTVARSSSVQVLKPRVLAVGFLDENRLAQAGMDAACFDALPVPLMQEKMAGRDVLIYRGSAALDATFLEACPTLKLIIRPGVGVDHIDLAAAKRLGIKVQSTPICSTASVAELTIALMVNLLRKIPTGDAGIRQGKWLKKQLVGADLAGKTIGIVGVGRIGRAVARRLAGFDVNVIGFDPFLHAEDFAQTGVTLAKSLEELLATADIVTLHVPLTDDTRQLINAKRLALMKTTALLVNASRGKVVDQKALTEALAAGRLGGAALDVYEVEPLALENELCRLPNVVLTPHIGGNTTDALGRIEEQTLELLADYQNNQQAALEVHAGGEKP